MSSIKINRELEKKEWARIKSVYGKTPTEKCPKCHKKSLFMINAEGGIFCVRCDHQVGIKKTENKD